MADPENRSLTDKFMLRLPDGLRDRIRSAADANNRSMNAEIIHVLESAYPAGPTAKELADQIGLFLAWARNAPSAFVRDRGRTLLWEALSEFRETLTYTDDKEGKNMRENNLSEGIAAWVEVQKEAIAALQTLEGNLSVPVFDPNDPDSVRVAEAAVAAAVDEKLAPFSTNPSILAWRPEIIRQIMAALSNNYTRD